MKIACIIHSLDGGGAERVMASLASRLAARGHRVTLVTLDDGSRQRHAVDATVVRRCLDLMGESRSLISKLSNTQRRVRGIRSALVDESPDVVLSFCDRTNILALMAARPLSMPVVVSERSDPSQQKLGMTWEYLRGRSYSTATTIIALTESSASYLGQRFQRPIVVIPSAVDEPPIRSDRDQAKQNRRILGVGRLAIEKGFDRLIDAFAQFADDVPDWSLRILGEGSLRTALEQQIDDLGLAERIALPGWISPVWDEIGAATIFALPSRYEGSPSALLEAMALGVPSIAVDCESGPRAVIDDSNCGLLVPNQTDALAKGLHRMIKEVEFRERLGIAGMSVIDRFGWDAMVDAYERILCDAANASGPRR